jgi:hypothetical protein
MRLALCAIAILCACARGGANAQQDGHVDTGSGSGRIDAANDGAGIDSNGCAAQPCTVDPQCGCTDPMKSACDLGSGSANACRYATTSGVEGQSCISSQGCAAQYTCVGGGGNYECEKYCASTSECISPRGQCVIQLNDGSGNPIPNAVVCSSNCDPSTATNPLCPSGWTCDLFTATYKATTYSIADCRVNGPAGLNAACSTTNQCQAGLSCVNTGSDVCKKICNKTANTGCTTGTCTSFTTAVKIPDTTGTEYGVCL